MIESFGITSTNVEEYIYGLLPESDSILSRLENEARKEGWPIVGPLVGKMLYTLAKIAKAELILELGSAIGYSTIWFARAIEEFGGKVISVEVNKDTAKRAIENINDAGLSNVVEIINDDAEQLVLKNRMKFDMVFLDLEKTSYPFLLEHCVTILKDGGILIADNCLLSGGIVEQNSNPTLDAIRRFNKRAAEHPQLEGTIIPIRDGVFVGRKK